MGGVLERIDLRTSELIAALCGKCERQGKHRGVRYGDGSVFVGDPKEVKAACRRATMETAPVTVYRCWVKNPASVVDALREGGDGCGSFRPLSSSSPRGRLMPDGTVCSAL